MVKLVHTIIEAKKKDESCKVPKDVAEVLLSENVAENIISDNIIDLMIPGEDSVPVLITLAIKYLSDCPAALQQLSVVTTCIDSYYVLLNIFSLQYVILSVGDESQEENMKLKELKDQTGEELIWSDYLSLPFTQTVCQF